MWSRPALPRTLFSVSVLLVAPGMATPFLYHWNEVAPAMLAERLIVPPALATELAGGWVLITGAVAWSGVVWGMRAPLAVMIP